ncbi:hypothetical protein [Pseudomonas spirodelae]|uniref:Uncharacterized protein n=1 Tax=Pseudomonas spirodelae TaxID=3101751 RepID=A0ABU5P7T9_9PSED|nr:hypothetical protein [Pseudomonas sp. T5W1]MEA1605734.1 hypothetical protein [Pseudomonas sp. T5W1]
MKLFNAIIQLVRNTVVPPGQRVLVTEKQKFDARQKDFAEISKIYDDMK